MFHNGWWWNNIIKIDLNLSSGWLYRWDENKANNDIQKVIGFTLDLGKKSIIRLGVNNGGSGRYYDGKNLMLWNYTNLNGKYTGHDSLNRIGKIPAAQDSTVYFRLDENGKPWWSIGSLANLLPYGQYEFKKGIALFGRAGINMLPYYEAGINHNGAPLDITANIKISLLDYHGNVI